MVGYVNCED